MTARASGKAKDRAGVAQEPDPEGPTSDDEIEILEVIGVNETEPVAGEMHHADPGSGHGTGDHHGDRHGLRYGDHPAEEASARDEARRQLDEAVAEKDRLHELWLRAQAETENVRKRAERDLQERRVTDAADLVRRLLPILDSLERAVETPGAGDDPVRKGVALTLQKMFDVLAKEGLKAIVAKGAPFDPHRHEAVEVVAVEGVEAGVVLEEMQRGYLFRDRLIRPSLVRVAAAKEQGEQPTRRAAG